MFTINHDLEPDLNAACYYDSLIIPVGHSGEAHSQLHDVWT